MVSFSCEACGDVVAKKKLDGHRNQCRDASFTCLDCMVHFHGTEYRSHTSCISEAQKYQGHLYREKGSNKRAKNDKGPTGNVHDQSQAMVPRGAYVEDVAEGDDMNAIAVIDVPPRAPTPPPAVEPLGELPSNVNVFDFLVTDDTPSGDRHALPPTKEQRALEHTPYANGDSQYSQFSNGDGSQYLQYGYSYGNAPVPPGLERYESWNDLADSQQSHTSRPASAFVTPGPKDSRKEKKDRRMTEKSEKKRKRGIVEELDLSSSKRPVSRDGFTSDAPIIASGGRVLHSGLTGGLSRLITDQEFYDDRIDAGPTPISPVKRSKRDKDTRDARDERRKSSYTSHVSSRAPSSKVSDDRRARSRSADRASSAQPQDHHHRHHNDKSHRGHTGERHRRRRDSASSADDNRHSRHGTDYPDRAGSVQPSTRNSLVAYHSRAELFMSFITKGPESERGCSINKALKRYHRERDSNGGDDRDDDDKELWKSLRLRRNSRGEVVLFV